LFDFYPCFVVDGRKVKPKTIINLKNVHAYESLTYWKTFRFGIYPGFLKNFKFYKCLDFKIVQILKHIDISKVFKLENVLIWKMLRLKNKFQMFKFKKCSIWKCSNLKTTQNFQKFKFKSLCLKNVKINVQIWEFFDLKIVHDWKTDKKKWEPKNTETRHKCSRIFPNPLKMF
jgi:hypothetical protein